jgi:hypothetical protein
MLFQALAAAMVAEAVVIQSIMNGTTVSKVLLLSPTEVVLQLMVGV